MLLIGLMGSGTQFAAGGIIFQFDDNSTPIGMGLDNLASGSFIVSGVEITATASTGIFNSTASFFGLDQPASDDDTAGFDFEEGGGPGVAEGLTVSFDSDVWLNSIDVSSFSIINGDQMGISFSGGSIATVTATGSTSLGNTFVTANDFVHDCWQLQQRLVA